MLDYYQIVRFLPLSKYRIRKKGNTPPPPRFFDMTSFPEGYTPDTVWQYEVQEGKFGGMNRPTAGARSVRALPIGQHPIQLYSLGTPNGQKVTILLEELVDSGAIESYDAYKINIMQLDQFTTGFTQINPNGKIPAMVDYGVTPPQRIFESGSILLYLADKYRQFIPSDPAARAECLSWLFWQMSTAPIIGGAFGHFYAYAPVKVKYAIDRYSMEVKRILDVLEQHLAGRDATSLNADHEPTNPRQFIMGDTYTIADMAIMPWVRCIDVGYKAGEFLQLSKYTNIDAWVKRITARKAVQRGLRVNGYTPDAVPERHSLADFGEDASGTDATPSKAAPAAAVLPTSSGVLELSNATDAHVGGRLVRLLLTVGGVPFAVTQELTSEDSDVSVPTIKHGSVHIAGAEGVIAYASEVGLLAGGVPVGGPVGPAALAVARGIDQTLVGALLTVERAAQEQQAVVNAGGNGEEARKKFVRVCHAALDLAQKALPASSARFVYGNTPSLGDLAVHELVRGPTGVSSAGLDAMRSHPRLAKLSSATSSDSRVGGFEAPVIDGQ